MTRRKTATAATDDHFPIIGIGASAGGLAAFEAFFSGMPRDSKPDMAFVLVQHLSPDHDSTLTDILRRYTHLEVSEVVDGVAVQPNHVYVIPPNHDMALIHGTLQLMEPSAPRGQRLTIDYFLRSLAQDQHERAVAIILSGTGSDGTLGIRAVKGEGGLVIVQEPDTAEYDGMPRSAIATELVDFVLAPTEMPRQISGYIAQVSRQSVLLSAPVSGTIEDSFKKIFILLRNKTGHDFSQYKHSTIYRRVQRRMAVQHITDLVDYVRVLQQSPAEVTALFYDILIGVTSFFRDKEVFDALAEKCIPRLLADTPVGSTIRIWTAACSTGEEAYSIAILLQEQMDATHRYEKVQLFATDIDSRAIELARKGSYPASIASDVSPERLARFFTREPDGGGYRVNKNIRDMLIFSTHDIIKNPPFSRLNLISCRNLLIYMSGELQKKLIPLFHYALKPGGMLLLGKTESVGDFIHLFSPLDAHSKLYLSKNAVSGAYLAAEQFPALMTERQDTFRSQGRSHETGKLSSRELVERFLLNKYAPVSALINGRGDIMYLHGRSGEYLELAQGEACINNILKTAREGLRSELTSALHRAVVHKEPVHSNALKVKSNGHSTCINLSVEPLETHLSASGGAVGETQLYVVTLEKAPLPIQIKAVKAAREVDAAKAGEDGGNLAALVSSLRQELHDKEEYLQSTNEELESSIEELKSANEEMQSINEELQSTNEELETSKEELQSLNEELSTVNSELNLKINDLSQSNNDMNNLLAGTGLGTIFVNHELCIQRFTPAVTRIISLIPADIGRPLGTFVTTLTNYDNLVEDVQDVLDTLVPKQIEVEIKGGEQFMLRIRPYRTLENVIEGAVITFVDITDIVKAREVRQRLGVVLDDANDAITVQTLDGSIIAWNAAAERMYGWSEAEALQLNISERIPEQERDTARAMMEQLSHAEVINPCRTRRLCRDGRMVDVWLTATALQSKDGRTYAIATTERLIGNEQA